MNWNDAVSKFSDYSDLLNIDDDILVEIVSLGLSMSIILIHVNILESGPAYHFFKPGDIAYVIALPDAHIHSSRISLLTFHRCVYAIGYRVFCGIGRV